MPGLMSQQKRNQGYEQACGRYEKFCPAGQKESKVTFHTGNCLLDFNNYQLQTLRC